MMNLILDREHFSNKVIKNASISLLLVIFLITSAYTQETKEPKMEKGMRIGKVIFYPSILFGYEYNDNVFSRNDQFEELLKAEVISDNIYFVKPTFKLVLPFSNSFARLSYNPQYRKYAEIKLEENISHFLNFDTKLKFSNGSTLVAKEEYTKGILEVETFDPGGEVVFGAEPFTFISTFIGFGHEFAGVRGFLINATYDDLSFDQVERGGLYDYEIKGLKGSYYQALSPRIALVSDYSFRNINQFDHIFEDNIKIGITKREEYDEYIIALGVRGKLLEKTTGSASLSYSNLDFKKETGSNFSGVTGEAALNTIISNNFSINSSLRRYAYQSFFLDNKYYISNKASVGIRYYLRKNIILNFKLSYFLNTYDKVIDTAISPLNIFNGTKREDENSRIDAGINYLFNDLSGVRVGYSYNYRESNVDLYDYKTNRFFIQIGFGWF